MATAGVVDVRVNPDNRDQWVVLFGNGRIDSRNCPPITDGPNGWFTRLDQPVAVAIHVYDWVAMKGYVFDKQGGVHPFGGANILAIGGENGAEVVGIPYWFEGIYVDWSWDPYHPGRGVALDGYGTLHAFGGAPAPFRAGYRWPYLIARKLVMSWGPVDMRAYTLDGFGGIHPDYSAPAVPASAGAPYHAGWDFARDLIITNWTPPAGYTLDLFGWPIPWGGAEPSTGSPYNNSGDWARRVALLNADDPTEFLEVWSLGQEFRWFASTPPTVVAGGVTPQSPASTVTTTTRPVLAWVYSDAQKDSQAEARVLVFTEAFASSHTMTDPLVHAASALVDETVTNPTTRGVTSPVDLPNGQYRMYVRARDTAGPASWSAWSSRSWTQNVPVPGTPTGLTAVPDQATNSVVLSVKPPTGGVAKLVRFEWSDDYDPAMPAAATWWPVFGADAVPLAATTTAVDRTARLGVDRAYRAVAYAVSPRTASLPSSTATATLTRLRYVLTALSNPALGGEVRAAGPMEWSRPTTVGVFEGIGAQYPTVVSDGTPKARRGTLRITAQDRAQWQIVKELAEADSVLLLRDPFGEAVYCRLVGDWTQRLLEAAPLANEDTPIRHMHATELPLVEVRPPHLAA